MAEVVITHRANDDIESLAGFISNDSETYAINQVQLIYEAIDTLVDFPEAGKIVPEFRGCSNFIIRLCYGSFFLIPRYISCRYLPNIAC
ncbi:MAG: type II toxin-antitoxin system RelE/ParE family toxin [Bacteroidota bacterium]